MTTGQLGRLPADPARYAATITLPLRAVPAHPLVADHLGSVPGWVLGRNDVFGTCGPVSVANHAVMTWKYLLGEDITVTDDAVFDLYRRSGNPGFDPATDTDDNGVDMTVMLSALVKGGLSITRAGGAAELVKPLCFAKTPVAVDGIRAYTSIFGGVLFGLDLDVAQQTQTVWDYAASPAWGGHATLAGAYTSATAAHQVDESLVTWAEVTGTTDAFLTRQLSEVYVVVWPAMWDHPAFQAGVDQGALAADYTAATGKPFPAPVPPAPAPPAPVPAPPAPAPAPLPPGDADAVLWSVAAGWAGEHHIGEGGRVARALRAWATVKGL